ncbi:exodeoxyribonuclease VII small subunit [Phormidium sp. CLA17]|uniref:exodeoxyribonuclease VII small subunit n=1 Tax=Leptolyngbya sp. Cla-17 TaxID=2803751 RepID=UPI001490FE32|nr:exodeoxyribonuclease VII small subunit [Leptolyngbya sp. Cla-17]MBM0740192.1 exodeoxyribonuclease VII small subunit [Leptolyngbya sp. Cla-17]
MSNLTNSTGADTNYLKPDNSEQPSVRLQDGWRYEATVKKIEAAIAQIESGELDLADVLDQFSEAVEDLRLCETFLSDRQQQVDLLIETLSDQPQF